jgi:hypothetical protein
LNLILIYAILILRNFEGGGLRMKSQIDRINRYRKAYPNSKMSNNEIINFLNFGKQLKKEINTKLTGNN